MTHKEAVKVLENKGLTEAADFVRGYRSKDKTLQGWDAAFKHHPEHGKYAELIWPTKE